MKYPLLIYGIKGRMGGYTASLVEESALFYSVGSYGNEIAASIIIDFTLAAAFEKNLTLALKHSLPIVIGTTALTQKNFKEIELASSKIPIFYASNFSIQIALMKKLSPLFSLQAKSAKIIETHHIHKKDSPSGTALFLQESLPGAEIISHRKGDVIGEHTLLFASEDETLEIAHRAHSRRLFAKGALRAAEFLLTKKKGLYTMEHLIENIYETCHV